MAAPAALAWPHAACRRDRPSAGSEALLGLLVEERRLGDVEAQADALAVAEAAVGSGENENIFSSNRIVGKIDGFSQDSKSTIVGIKSPDSPAALAPEQG